MQHFQHNVEVQKEIQKNLVSQRVTIWLISGVCRKGRSD